MDEVLAVKMINQLVESAFCVPKIYYGLLVGLGFCVYYFFEVVKAPLLVCADGPFRDFLEENVPILKSKFWPTLWCFESRAQTIMASVVRSRLWPAVEYRREILTLKSDGGEVALDWFEENCRPNSPTVLILPGLTGSAQAEYIKILVNASKKLGIRLVIFNNRGLGGVTLKTPRLYCASNCEDLDEVIAHVKSVYPNVPLAATGISMGGMILGNWLIQQGRHAMGKIKACYVISVPWNVFEGTKNIEKPYLNMMLNKHLAGNLRKNLERHFSNDRQQLNVELDPVLQSKTVREFDEYFTSKHFGYKDVDHYYSVATLHDKLHRIEVPMLCLNSADDPFQPLRAIPLQEVSRTKQVAMVVTSRGGHIGFLEGIWPIREEQYIGKIFTEFFTAVFTKGEEHPAFL